MNLISNKDLYDLVKSLSKSEKRFIKLTASASNIDVSLLDLFTKIENLSAYKEDVFTKSKSKTESTLPKNIISENLYQFLLKSLRGFYAESSPSLIIKDEINNILNLLDKAQYKQCRKILNKQKQVAYQYERFHFILELITLEKLLINIERQFNVKNNTIEDLVKEEQMVIEKAKNLGQYTLLHSKINLNTRQKNKAKTESDLKKINDSLNSELLKDESQLKSLKSKIIYHHCRSILFCRCQDNQNREEECELLLKIMDGHKELIEEMPGRYITTLSNLINIAYEEKRYKSCEARIKTLEEKLSVKAFGATDLQLKIITAILNSKIAIYTNSGKLKEAKAVAEEIEKTLEEYQDKINKEEQLVFYYNISVMHIYFNDFKKAHHYISLILNEGNNLLREDIQSFARILNIITHYELGNIKQLGYLITTIKNFYKSGVSSFKSEKLIIHYFEKLIQHPEKDKKHIQTLFKDFKQELSELMKDAHETNVTYYFEIEAYIDSKISERPLSSILNEKYKKAWLN